MSQFRRYFDYEFRPVEPTWILIKPIDVLAETFRLINDITIDWLQQDLWDPWSLWNDVGGEG